MMDVREKSEEHFEFGKTKISCENFRRKVLSVDSSPSYSWSSKVAPNISEYQIFQVENFPGPQWRYYTSNARRIQLTRDLSSRHRDCSRIIGPSKHPIIVPNIQNFPIANFIE